MDGRLNTRAEQGHRRTCAPTESVYTPFKEPSWNRAAERFVAGELSGRSGLGVERGIQVNFRSEGNLMPARRGRLGFADIWGDI